MHGRMKILSREGFGLVEVIIAIGIFAFALLTTAFSVLNLHTLGELSREKVAAVADANRVLEAMRDMANTSLETLRSTNWTNWAGTNIIGPKGAYDPALAQENVAAVIGTGNPAAVTVTVNWTHRQRPYSHTTTTLMTDRN